MIPACTDNQHSHYLLKNDDIVDHTDICDQAVYNRLRNQLFDNENDILCLCSRTEVEDFLLSNQKFFP